MDESTAQPEHNPFDDLIGALYTIADSVGIIAITSPPETKRLLAELLQKLERARPPGEMPHFDHVAASLRQGLAE